MSKALITTVPFGDKDSIPFDLLNEAGIEYVINPLKKKLTEDELWGMIQGYDYLIAGTERISAKVLERADQLKFISRVGIGLDSVDLIAAQRKGIKVSYTPDAPAPAVAELTLGMMLTLMRSLHISNQQLHEGKWERIFGRRLGDVTIGLIGLGRIGKRVFNHLEGFNVPKILVNDIVNGSDTFGGLNVQWASKECIYKESDLISLHLPLNSQTRNLIGKNELLSMKKDAVIINTSRGGIINEKDLYEVLKSGHLAAAGIDVFEQEPYDGPLKEISNCLLTAHMGSMSIDCRTKMEIEATEEVVRFHRKIKLNGAVPDIEYILQSEKVQ